MLWVGKYLFGKNLIQAYLGRIFPKRPPPNFPRSTQVPIDLNLSLPSYAVTSVWHNFILFHTENPKHPSLFNSQSYIYHPNTVWIILCVWICISIFYQRNQGREPGMGPMPSEVSSISK